MLKLTEEQKSDDLVKSLLSGGFEEDTIAGWLHSGQLMIEKSTQYGADDHGEGDGESEKRGKKGLEKRKKEDEYEEGEKKEEEGEEEEFKKVKKEKMIEKSLNFSEMFKSIEESLLEKVQEENNLLSKSLPKLFESALIPFQESIAKSIATMQEKIEAFGKEAPGFKGADLSRAVLEKSIAQGGGAKDEAGHMALSVSRDRTVVKEIIMKAISEETDDNIKKSLYDNTSAYCLDAVTGAIGEAAAMYLYSKKNIRLVK